MCHVLLCKIGLLIISFIHVGNRGNYIFLCVAPNGMKFLWWTDHIMNSLYLNFHIFCTLYVGVMYFSCLYGWILCEFS
jgi:hypothetical protein